jgi:hypothetical protein
MSIMSSVCLATREATKKVVNACQELGDHFKLVPFSLIEKVQTLRSPDPVI